MNGNAGLSSFVFETSKRASRFLSQRSVNVSFKIAFSAILIYFVLGSIDMATTAGRFEGQAASWIVLAALLTAIQILLGGLRWNQILKALDAEVSTRSVLKVAYIGSFFTCWFFGAIGGDAARVLLIRPRDGKRTTMVHSVLFDRILALAALGLTVLPGVILRIGPFARDTSLYLVLVAAALPLVGMAVVERIARLGDVGKNVIAAQIAGLAESWRRVLRARSRFAWAFGLSAANQITIAGVAWTLAQAQHLDVSFFDFVMLMPPVVLLVTLPISAGGWGIRENAIIAGLAAVGVAHSAAFLVSVEMGALAALLSLPAGAIWFLQYGVRVSSLAAPPPEPT